MGTVFLTGTPRFPTRNTHRSCLLLSGLPLGETWPAVVTGMLVNGLRAHAHTALTVSLSPRAQLSHGYPELGEAGGPRWQWQGPSSSSEVFALGMIWGFAEEEPGSEQLDR
jgi:hypothetical protein